MRKQPSSDLETDHRCVHEEVWALTRISLSESPRRSCVRCSLKHPVPNERAASVPALNTAINVRKSTAQPFRDDVHERIGSSWTVDATITRDIINFAINLQ